MKTLLTIIILLGLIGDIRAQALTLADCYERAEANYPLIRSRQLIEKARIFSMENARSGHLPQITLAGQATYQSDVTRIPIEMPGIDPLAKDQYRIIGEVSQTLYQGRLVEKQVRAKELDGLTEGAQLEVDLYQVRSRIDDLFFGILLLQEQMRQSALVKADLETSLRKTQAALDNGVAIRSDADVLQAEILRVEQRTIELESTADAYRNMLGRFIGQPVTGDVTLTKPEFATEEEQSVQRPELQLFDLQKQRIDASRAVLSASMKPRLEMFVQGGYGRPGLNMLENEFKFYYIGGIRLNWRLSRLYTFGREKEILALRAESLDAQKETFLFNTNLAADQQRADIARLRRLIDVDERIVSLRTGVKETASVQLEQGVISASDYVREVNAADQAAQNRAVHEVQLLMAEAKFRFTTGLK